jgi:hypothetical protein
MRSIMLTNGEQSAVPTGEATGLDHPALLGAADGARARSVAWLDPGVEADQLRRLGRPGRLRSRPSRPSLGRGLVPCRSPAARTYLAKQVSPGGGAVYGRRLGRTLASAVVDGYVSSRVHLVANSGRHGQERPSRAWLKSWLAHHCRCWSLRLLHFTAAPRTPNPLILVRGFATILNNASTPALTSVYSSRGMNPAWRRFASLLVQRWGLKCGSRNLADTYVSRLLPPRRIAG